MDGQGEYSWADGRKYKGEFKMDQKDGHGTLKWPDGRVYVGQWKNNKQNGRGVLTNAEGVKKDGEFLGGVCIWYYDENGDRLSSDTHHTLESQLYHTSSGSGRSFGSLQYNEK